MAAADASLRLPSGDRWVVGIDAPGRHAVVAELQSHGATVRPLAALDALVVAGGDHAAVIRTLRSQRGRVSYVESVLERRLLVEPADATDQVTGRPYDWAQIAVGARAAIAAAAGGAPDAPVAVVDSGVQATHPDLVGSVLEGRSISGGDPRADEVGHGTFVAGLINATDGNGMGGFGVAGKTPVIPVKVTNTGRVSSADLAAGITAAVDAGAKVINVSIGGPSQTAIEQAALDYATRHDVLVVASAGNSGDDGNPLEYPAAALGGEHGGWATGLSVAASTPSGAAASFSTHNRFVSLAAPGAGAGPCTDGVYSTIPASALLWSGGPCDRTFSGGPGGGRYGYGEGTSFSAPMVAGAAALVRHVRPQLSAPQTADVLTRSASQTAGTGWNESTGAGVLDMPAAIALARTYDLTPPAVDLTVSESSTAARVVARAEDRTTGGQELAGGVSLEVTFSRDGVGFTSLASVEGRPFDQTFGVSATQPQWFRARACDRNRNCAERMAGPFTGSAVPKAARPALAPGVRVTLLAVGIRRCPLARRGCLRVAWRASPTSEGSVRYSLRLERPHAKSALARRTGRARLGRRIVADLPLRRGPICGRMLVRIRVSRDGATGSARRHLALPACRAERARPGRRGVG